MERRAEVMPQPRDGHCDSSFAAVGDAFAENLTHDDETGAAVCIYVDGTKVVDLWGGYADLERRLPWQRDTIVNAYSIGKGVLSALVLTLAERGRLDLDLTVADVWPEFAAEDKARVTLPTLLAHRGGMPAVRKRLPEGAMLDWNLMCSELAAQQPYWQPGTRHGYHTNTYGYLIGEVIRRGTGTPVAEALQTYVTGPLQADFAWGIAAQESARIARMYSPDADYVLREPEDWHKAFPPTGDTQYDEMIWHSYFNPSGLSGGGVVNSLPWREAVIPSTNGHGNARAVATIYDALLAHGGNAPLLASAQLVERAHTIHADGEDIILKRPSRFGLGFQLSQPSRPLGPNPNAFGHYGFGGSLGFADPDAGLAFGYVRNRPGQRWQTPRTQALIDAAYQSLSRSAAACD
ncbi:MAG: beta-lactamase family protein [Deltaproteobacteria bacterium]|nr:beta-lactamase family protein [Deltaproteobacteria bacterium]